MEKLRFTTTINAPRQKVWDTMLNDQTYRQWTEPFHAGSYYEGEWKTGSDMKFLGPEENGNISGMFSKIKECRPPEYVSIQHLGEILNGKKQTWKSQNKGDDAFENYTFKESPDGTELTVEMDSPKEYKEMFQKMWPQALKKLKEISEA